MSATLGQFIRARREQLGLTQEELAERVGAAVRQSEISRLERGRVSLPRRERLELLAVALEVSIGELLMRSGWMGDADLAPPAAGLDDPAAPVSEEGAVLADTVSALQEIVITATDSLARAEAAMAQLAQPEATSRPNPGEGDGTG